MQQFDEIKRMSELAKQMRELGLAKNNSDAYNQARSVTSSDPAVARERKAEELTERMALLERKHEAQTRTIEDLKQQLGESNQRLADVLSKMSQLSAKLRDLEVASTANIPAPQWQPQPPQWQPPAQQSAWQPAPQPAQATAQSVQSWDQAYPPQQRVETRPPSTAPIDRNGVAPSDVSVEKFFYFGNKR